jgi:L-methionine (R)-S-oxide reductase
MSQRLSSINPQLAHRPNTSGEWSELLAAVLQAFDCQTGTIHELDSGTNQLKLKAQKGIPDFLLEKVQNIPMGKGIAGAAAQRAEPVQLCNLQTDDTGVARPDAKATKVEGALAVPVFADGRVAGVLGIGKMQPYDFSESEIADLRETAARISSHFTPS